MVVRHWLESDEERVAGRMSGRLQKSDNERAGAVMVLVADTQGETRAREGSDLHEDDASRENGRALAKVAQQRSILAAAQSP